MEMALEGRLHEFNPDDYTEPELPHFAPPEIVGPGRSQKSISFPFAIALCSSWPLSW